MVEIKEVNLTKGFKAIVDDEDYDSLNNFKWRIHSGGYAVRNTSRKDGQRKIIYMHREIMKLKENEEFVVDHINHNKLDNRKINLRVCTQQQNNFNKTSLKNSSSKYKGVVVSKSGNFQMCFILNKKVLVSMMFSDEMASANAYNYYATLYHKEFAKLNDVPYMTKDDWIKYRVINKKGKYAGIDFVKSTKKWRSRLKIKGEELNLGQFLTEKEALVIRNNKVIELGMVDKCQEWIGD